MLDNALENTFALNEISNIELEKQLISCLLSDWSNFEQHTGQISIDLFTNPLFRLIFQILEGLFRKNGNYDIFTVIDSLKNKGKEDWEKEVLDIYSLFYEGSLDSCLKVLIDYNFRRQLLKVGKSIYNLGCDRSLPLEQIEFGLEAHLDTLLTAKSNQRLELVATSCDRVANFINSGNSKGVTTGFPTLDRLIGGFKPGKVYIIGARTAMGKTNIAVHYALNIIKSQKHPVLFFSAEMSLENLAIRFLANLSGVNSSFIANNYMSYEEQDLFQAGLERYKHLNLIIDESSAQSLDDRSIGEKLRSVIKNYSGIGAVIIDYIQLLGSYTVSRRDLAIGEVIRACKDLAKRYQVPFLVLAQVRREVENRQNKRPTLSDLKDSATLEQAADLVMYVYRDEYYNEYTDLPNITELIIAKNRDGACGTVALKHDLGTCKYIETKIAKG